MEADPVADRLRHLMSNHWGWTHNPFAAGLFGVGVSSKGDFIVGQGDFPGAPFHAFLVRYDDGNQPKGNGPIAGLTTVASVQASVDDLGRARQQTMIQQQALAAVLLEPMGSNQQMQFANGLSLLANASFTGNDSQEAAAHPRGFCHSLPPHQAHSSAPDC